MSQAYALHVLKVAVAKICQTIGWHSTHTTTIDLLIDVTQHFLREISRIMMRYCELYNRTEPNLDDLALAYRDIGINMQELMEYIQFVDPIALPFAVPRFPVARESNLNFLKPGSREMMMRPLHIPMYMPPMYPELEDGAERADGSELGHNDEKALVRVTDASGASLPPAVFGDAGEPELMHEGATLTEIIIDETGEKMDTGETVTLVEDGALAPEALVNEEVEIPMQTLEIKEAGFDEGPASLPPPPPPPTPPPLPPASADGAPGVPPGETDAKRPEPPAESDRQGEAAGGKSNAGATAGEGRPTRSISSVIMTTSGFISPAREGKLPDSRIPIIPEERPPRTLKPPPAPLCAPPAALPVAAGLGAASAQALSAPPSGVSGSSVHPAHAALLPTLAPPANPREHKHGSVSATATTTTTTSTVGTPFAVHEAAAGAATATATTPSLAASGVKQPGGGEKPSKKTKKKPSDRERKKGDKKKGEKPSGSVKPPPVGELPAGDGQQWSAVVHSSSILPPVDAAAGAGQHGVATVVPFLSAATEGVPSPFAFSATSTLPTDGTADPGKPVKPPKTKVRKEKVLKKRKILPTPPTAEVGPTFPTPDAIPLTTTTTTTTTTPELFDKLPEPLLPPPPPPTPKQSKVKTKRLKQAKKLQALQAGDDQQAFSAPSQLDQEAAAAGPNQPPPLIDPWRVAALAGEKLPGAPAPEGDVAKPRKQKASSKHPKGEMQVTEQAAQLSLLQKMHPSLEITTSPAPEREPSGKHSGKKSGTKSKSDGKGHRAPIALLPAAAVPPFTPDRDVIVIDDDKSPPHTPTPLMASPGAPPESKKQRKATPGGAAFFSPEHGLGAGAPGELASPPGAGPLSFRDFSSPEVHPGAIPKTPDIRLPSASSSSSSCASTTSKASESIWAAKRTLLAGPNPTEKKQKRPKQKPPKGSTDGAKQPKLQQQQQQPDQEPVGAGQGVEFGQPPGLPGAAGRNPFALFGPGGPGGLGQYTNYLNQSLSARMPFGLFPFPSGPGLIPDGPLFPLQPGTFPMGPGNFPLPPNPFGLPGINNLLRLPRLGRPLGGGGSGSLNPYQNPYDDSIDTETKLAQTPLDLQKSNCNVAPLVPPSLFQEVQAGDESLNLSMRLGWAAGAGGGNTSTSTSTSISTSTSTKQTATVLPQKKTAPVGPTATTSAAIGSSSQSQVSFSAEQSGGAQEPTGGSGGRQPEARKEDQVVILPAASVLLGASPPQRSSVCVIDIDDSDGSQSTTGDRGKEAKRKGAGKEHKKDRKLKDGKVKKKKDKKDKNRSKEREREQQLKELSAGTASSSAVMTMGMIGAEEALMEQLRKERKEKKEKRKDKLKKEKRKERERLQLAAATDQPPVPSLVVSTASLDTQAGGGEPGTTVPKLIMKLGGSVTTPSPRSDTPDHQHAAAATAAAVAAGGGPTERKRDGSPELARISALVTRPPKLKVPFGPGSSSSSGGGKSKKDDSPTKAAMGVVGSDGAGGVSVDHGQTGFEPSDTGKHSLGTGTFVAAGGDAGDPTQAFGFGGSVAPVASGTATSKGSSKAGRGASLGGGVEYVSSSGSKASAGDTGSSRKAPKDSGSSKGSKSSSSAHHHHHHHAAATTLAAPAHMTDADGNTVWICPACGRVDDGTPMIGCDGCDAWYHWVCVGIQVPPDDNEDWYCRVCIGKKQDSHTDSEKQRKRKKKDKKTPKD